MLLADLVSTSAAVSATTSRLAKVDHIADALRAADADEVALVVSYLAGELRQRKTGVGWAAFRERPTPATQPSLGVSEVDAAFETISQTAGRGSTATRRQLLNDLLSRATEDEQHYLARLAMGELRQGALDGVMIDAVIRTSEAAAADVRRAVMLAGTIPPVAGALLAEGPQALERFKLELGRPLRPMLASPAPDMDAALDKSGLPAALEWKLDGIRVQVHRVGDQITIYTRTLDEVTSRLPEVVEAVAALEVDQIVLDGEVIALGDDERPKPFQVTASRVGSKLDLERLRREVPVHPFFFDILHLDGHDLLGETGAERLEALQRVVPTHQRVPRLVTDDPAEAARFFGEATDRGHEGVVVKSLDTAYEAGRRGSSWIKVKPRHTLDLVVLAVEWGSGRRTGMLSNIHLGARNPETGEFVMLGKTFKGLTDEMLRWQTKRFLELEDHRDDWTVYVRPEQVVEIAFDGVQTSKRYPAGMALRFARVVRYRLDKRADEADTVDAVRTIHYGNASR